jgi:hypothetical protein
LLDLRKLPADWQTLAFDDSTWENAVPAEFRSTYTPMQVPYRVGDFSLEGRTLSQREISPFHQQSLDADRMAPIYEPRSIPFLTDVTIPITVTEINIELGGTATDSDIASVRLYEDVNNNGAYDSGTDLTRLVL